MVSPSGNVIVRNMHSFKVQEAQYAPRDIAWKCHLLPLLFVYVKVTPTINNPFINLISISIIVDIKEGRIFKFELT